MGVNTLRLLGETVRVHKGGIVWDCRANGTRYVIGKTRAEALETLRRIKGASIEALETSAVRPLQRPKPVAARTRPEMCAESMAIRAYKRAYYYAKSRAQRGNKQVLTEADFWRLVERAEGRCEVTGIRFSSEKPRGFRVAPWAPSIDRVDSGHGYEANNCRLVCASVNMALNDFGVDVLLRIANALMNRPGTVMLPPVQPA